MNIPAPDVGPDLELSGLALLEAFPSAVVVCALDGTITYGNNELFQMFGYSVSELIGQPVETLIPQVMRQQHPQLLKQYMSNPQKRNLGGGRVLHGQHKAGWTFPVEIGLNPIDTNSGRQIIATVANITQRCQAEENFRNVVEAAPVGMLMVDAEGKIEHCNQQLLKTFGYELNELVAKPVEVLVPERYRDNHPHYRKGYQSKPDTRSMGLDRALTGLHKSGSEFPVEVGLNPIQTGRGITVIAAVIDITERKKTELQLKQVNADLDEFTYVASHDLKSPLRGISSLMEWIEEDLGDDLPEEVKHNLERVHLRIGRMEKLIEDLLVFARSGRDQGNVTTVKISQLMENVTGIVDIPKGFKVTTSGYTGTIQSVMTPLETVLRNLVSNAVKHHDREQGSINITVTVDDHFCIFEIEDDGPGIPENAQERIFKLFQSLSHKEGRSGVGLAVCKRLVESCGGRIEVESQENQRGCIFRFWWPRFARRDINV